eukprot:1139067-Pelagomonas_calceolata.AAC.2
MKHTQAAILGVFSFLSFCRHTSFAQRVTLTLKKGSDGPKIHASFMYLTRYCDQTANCVAISSASQSFTTSIMPDAMLIQLCEGIPCIPETCNAYLTLLTART